MKLKAAFLITFLIFKYNTTAQDHSWYTSKIVFSAELKSAKKFSSLDKALVDPSKVVWLEFFTDELGINYKKFCANISKFTNLRKLYIVNYYGTKEQIPEELWTLTKLEYLSLDDFKNEEVNGISNLTELKFLNLDEFMFSQFPVEIFKLKNLAVLDLSMNLIKELPAGIAELTSLREIELTNNCFSEVPNNIQLLPQLEYFIMNNADFKGIIKQGMENTCENGLVTFPDVFSKMKKLVHVSCFYGVRCDKAMKKKIKETYTGIKFS